VTASRLVVERVDRITTRPWLYLTGRWEGDSMAPGDEMTIEYEGRDAVSAVIRGVEFHTPRA
jgi:hypothetical protein